jgi:hypothetical protein
MAAQIDFEQKREFLAGRLEELPSNELRQCSLLGSVDIYEDVKGLERFINNIPMIVERLEAVRAFGNHFEEHVRDILRKVETISPFFEKRAEAVYSIIESFKNNMIVVACIRVLDLLKQDPEVRKHFIKDYPESLQVPIAFAREVFHVTITETMARYKVQIDKAQREIHKKRWKTIGDRIVLSCDNYMNAFRSARDGSRSEKPHRSRGLTGVDDIPAIRHFALQFVKLALTPVGRQIIKEQIDAAGEPQIDEMGRTTKDASLEILARLLGRVTGEHMLDSYEKFIEQINTFFNQMLKLMRRSRYIHQLGNNWRVILNLPRRDTLTRWKVVRRTAEGILNQLGRPRKPKERLSSMIARALYPNAREVIVNVVGKNGYTGLGPADIMLNHFAAQWYEGLMYRDRYEDTVPAYV